MNISDKFKFIPKIKNQKDSRYEKWPANNEDYRDLPKTKSKVIIDLNNLRKEEEQE